MPVKTITENGSVIKYDSGHVVKNNDSTIHENKNAHIVSDSKTVVKNKQREGFNWWWLLVLIPAPLLFRPVRQKVRNIVFPYLKIIK